MPAPTETIMGLKPYVPGLSIEEIRQKYGLERIIKLASNENPLGASPRVQETIRRLAHQAFRYPQGGNPRLKSRLAALHGVTAEKVAAGNGSDEVIDLLIRMLALPGKHNIVCFRPCFSIYPIQAEINGVEVKRVDLEENFSFSFDRLLDAVDASTRLVFITTPDNPSGYCPPATDLRGLAESLATRYPDALLVIDEAYMDFADNEDESSLLKQNYFPDNVAYLRTFSKSRGMAGLRLGYAIMPEIIADGFWRTRLPFSINILAEEAAMTALEDEAFYEKTLATVREGRVKISSGLKELGCQVWPSEANFVMFKLPGNSISADECQKRLLEKGIIIRSLKSYNLPEHMRVSIGSPEENGIFLSTLKDCIRS